MVLKANKWHNEKTFSRYLRYTSLLVWVSLGSSISLDRGSEVDANTLSVLLVPAPSLSSSHIVLHELSRSHYSPPPTTIHPTDKTTTQFSIFRIRNKSNEIAFLSWKDSNLIFLFVRFHLFTRLASVSASATRWEIVIWVGGEGKKNCRSQQNVSRAFPALLSLLRELSSYLVLISWKWLKLARNVISCCWNYLQFFHDIYSTRIAVMEN